MDNKEFLSAYVETGRFTFGTPSAISVVRSPAHVFFLRSRGGSCAERSLWRLDTTTGAEECIFDASRMGAEFSDLPEAERIRRERLRDIASGVSSYSVSKNADTAAIVVGGRLILLDLQTARWDVLGDSGVTHPLASPDGKRVAYAREGAVFVANVVDRSSKRITPDDAPAYWGIPEFVAAEEIMRFDAMWWPAQSDHLLITRVDDSDLSEMWIGNLEDQSVKPKSFRFPLAGNPNSRVRLYVYGIDSGTLRQVEGWDMELFPYLVRVSIQDDALIALVQSRDQKQYELLSIDARSCTATCIERGRLEPWVPIHCGLPTVDHEGAVTVEHIGTSRVAKLPNQKTSDTSLNVDAFVSSAQVRLIATYSIEKYRRSVVAWNLPSGSQRISIGHVSNLSLHGETVVFVEESLDSVRPKTRVLTRRADLSWEELACIQSYASDPDMPLNVRKVPTENDMAALLLLPSDCDGSEKLPVLLDPYGGPLIRKAVESKKQLIVSQWFANHGFAVLVADGRGTPSCSSEHEYAISGNLLDPVVEDQVSALQCASQLFPFLDISRVGIRGSSFGGYVAAAALFTRPDIFRCAIVGAPVADWRLYDTYYSERYLGHPATNAESYNRSSLLRREGSFQGAMLLLHGLSDDNVLAQNSIQLANRLFVEGCGYLFIPLPGVTHIAPQATLGVRLLERQLDFLLDELKVPRKLRTDREFAGDSIKLRRPFTASGQAAR